MLSKGLLASKPRIFDVARGMAKDGPPTSGRRSISKPEMGRRLDPLMELVASGALPLDSIGPEAVAAAMEQRWKEAQGGH
jgi:hypothetical protein